MNFYFSFQGRATRSDYWLRLYLPFVVILIILTIIDGILGTNISLGANQGLDVGVISQVFSIVAMWPFLAVSAKRMHDRDKSGWWLLLYLIPLIGAVYLFVVIGILRGTVGDNQFGPDPLGASHSM